MMQTSERGFKGVALVVGGVLAAGALAHSAPAQAKDNSDAYKTGAVVLGTAAAYMILKGKTLPGVLAGAGAYYAYKTGRKDERGQEYPTYPGGNYPGQYPTNTNPRADCPPNAYPTGGYPTGGYPNGPQYPRNGRPFEGNGNRDHCNPGSNYPNTTYPSGNYPNTTYPSGNYPNATYPNATYPAGNYPNATYPNATYPNATYPGGYSDNYPGEQYPTYGGRGVNGNAVGNTGGVVSGRVMNGPGRSIAGTSAPVGNVVLR